MSTAAVQRIARIFQLWRLGARRRGAFSKYLRLGKASVHEKSERLEQEIAEQLAEIQRLDERISELRGKSRRPFSE